MCRSQIFNRWCRVVRIERTLVKTVNGRGGVRFKRSVDKVINDLGFWTGKLQSTTKMYYPRVSDESTSLYAIVYGGDREVLSPVCASKIFALVPLP